MTLAHATQPCSGAPNRAMRLVHGVDTAHASGVGAECGVFGLRPELFVQLAQHSTDIIIVTDAQHRRIVWVNPAFTQLTGYQAEEAIGRSPGELLQGPATDSLTVARMAKALGQGAPIRVEILNYSKLGREYWLDISLVPLRDANSELTHFAAIERDITQTKTMQRELRALADIDAVTGVANRRSLGDALAREITVARENSRELALLVFDLDRFKLVNDKYGHGAGDAVLAEVARRCQSQLRPQDLIARFGGEEFAVLLPGVGPALAAKLAERLRMALAAKAVVTDNAQIAVTASFGVAMLMASDDSFGERIMRRADRHMVQAKAAGRNRIRMDDVAATRAPAAPQDALAAAPTQPSPAPQVCASLAS